MSVTVTHIAAHDVLTMEVVDQGRAGVWFLNWNVSVRPIGNRRGLASSTFAGMGLYGLCFDHSLIYIGSYLGSNKCGSFSGDVVQSRWWTHIGAITARGHRVHIGKQSLQALCKDYGEHHVMVNGFLSAQEPQLLHQDNGNLSPLRRLRFAASRSQEFFAPDAKPDHILNRFDFVYARLDTFPEEVDLKMLEARVSRGEREFIASYAPVCNSTYVPKGMPPKPVALDKVGDLLRVGLMEALHQSP